MKCGEKKSGIGKGRASSRQALNNWSSFARSKTKKYNSLIIAPKDLKIVHSWPKYYSFIKITCFTTLVSADVLSRTVIHIGRCKWAGKNWLCGKYSVKTSPTKLMTMNKFLALVIVYTMTDTCDNEFKQCSVC